MIRSPGRVSTDVNFWCVSINKTRVSGSLSVLSGLLWCVYTMLCIIPHSQDPSDCHYWDSPDYLLGRARNVTPFLWWASHRAQICLASPGCCWLYYASKILMGRDGDCGDNILPDNEDNKPLSVSDCRTQYQNILSYSLTCCPHLSVPGTHQEFRILGARIRADSGLSGSLSLPLWLAAGCQRALWLVHDGTLEPGHHPGDE